MRNFILGFLAGAVIACVGTVAVSLRSNAECFYDGRRIFSGTVTMTGDGLDGFQERLTGEWALCTDRGATCNVNFGKEEE